MIARFYAFAKRPNSTKIPDGNIASVDAEVVLLDNCSMLTPSLIVQHRAKNHTYVYIPDFNRYYFVHKVTILNARQWQYDLVVDVLASHKSQIVGSNQYVIRAASNYNLFLPDDTAVHTTDFSETVSTHDFPGYDSAGTYIITVVNASASTSANPASTMYALNTAGLTQLVAEMFDLDNYSDLADIDLTATYFNPQQYITSAKWFPFTLTDIAGDNPFELIKYGWYTSKHAGGYRVTAYGRKLTFTFTLGNYDSWVDRDNDWTRYSLYVPGFGITEIDAAFSGQTLTATISVDYNTGGATMILTTGTGQICASMTGQIGVEVAINQVGGSIDIPTSTGGIINKGAQFIGSAVSGGGGKSLAKTITGFLKMYAHSASGNLDIIKEDINQTVSAGQEAATAVANAAKQTLLNPIVTTSGADGARKTIIDNHKIYLYKRQYAIYNSNRSPRLGLPVHKREVLSSYSGYVVCANGTINISCFAEERNAIIDFLEGGFFIE